MARLVLLVASITACSRPPAKPREIASGSNENVLRNVAHGCRYVYEGKPSAYTVVVVGDRVVWIDDILDQIHIAPVGGGDITTFKSSEELSIHEAIVVGDDVVVTNAERDAVQRISLRERRVSTLVDGIRHPYELAFAAGKYFIGGEDNFYRFDPATKDLVELHEGSAWELAAFGDTVYVALEEQLLAIDARTEKATVLVKVLADIDRSEVEPMALGATGGGPIWSTAAGAVWTFDIVTRRPKKLAQLKEPVLQILPVGAALYFASGADVHRLRAGKVDIIPIDKRGWEEPEDPRVRIIAIGVHEDALVFHAPYTAFATACLE